MSDDNVVNFPSDADASDTIIWICNCLSSTFHVRKNGGMECSGCGHVFAPSVDNGYGKWVHFLPSEDPPPEDTVAGTTAYSVHELGAASLAQRRTLAEAKAWAGADDLMAVLAIRRNGAASGWAEFKDEDAKMRCIGVLEDHMRRLRARDTEG